MIDHHGGIGHTAVRGQLRYHPGPDLDIMLSADYTHIDQTNTAAVLTFANLNNVNTNPAPGIPFDQPASSAAAIAIIPSSASRRAPSR